jgi:hypothetical protein
LEFCISKTDIGSSEKNINGVFTMEESVVKLKDFMRFDNIPTSKIKVKFNMNAEDNNLLAWDYLKYDDGTSEYAKWIEMNALRKKHYNNNLDDYDYLLAFAQYNDLGQNYYIFGGMYKVEKIIPEVINGTGYKLTLMDNFKEYRRRLIIKTSTTVSQSYGRVYDSVFGDNSKLNPIVYEILPPKTIDNFPGFNKVLLTHQDLQKLFKNDAPEWRNQLSSVKGVYCITDTSNGKMYIGSAYGDYAGIWQRWKEYANIKKLTGGNKAFEEIKKINPKYIPENLTYSILEIFDP